MSRRHRGRSRNAAGRGEEQPRTQARTEPRPVTPPERPSFAAAIPPVTPAPRDPVQTPIAAPDPVATDRSTEAGPPPLPVNGASPQHGPANGHDARSGCTAPQLRRFIKSRPYVPMHELRRRFGINGAEDDVTPLSLDRGSIYVGLPERECRLLGELVRGGEVGYQLSLDPRTPIVVGVFPMRPVPRA